MEVSGFNEKEISERNKKVLQSEIWQEARNVMKTEVQHFTEAPDIQHFAIEKVSKNDNVYGVAWGNVVREYLKTAYSEKNAQADVVSDGITYKVLKREEVTAFYDADGNTLFDVENKRLEKEYEWVLNDSVKADKGIVNSEKSEKDADRKENVTELLVSEEKFTDAKEVNDKPAKQRAAEKLEEELKTAKEKTFAEPVISFLLERCAEDEGLAQDVVQEHKTWGKCLDYIYEQARRQATGNRAAVRGDVVYEWAEDYYHKDDKAEEEKKAREAAERKKKQEERAKKAESKPKKEEAPKPREEPKTKKNSKDMDGQLDMFSIMEM